MRRQMMLLYITVLIMLWATVSPAAGQDTPFATNTPAPTPVQPTTPAAPLNRYALRSWQPGSLVEVLESRIDQLGPGTTELQKAVRLLQYELAQRFPRASGADYESLLSAMLDAPAGSVDMRAVVRPYIERIVNGYTGNLPVQPFAESGFSIEPLPANLDGREPQDVVLHVRYPDTAAPVIYEDYVPLLASESGQYRRLVARDLPAGPLADVTGLILMGIGDFNGDRLDEIAISIQRDTINREMRVFGWRGDTLVNLVQPGSPLLFGELVSGLNPNSDIIVKMYREESPAWQCLGEQEITWRWTANFFRPTPAAGGFIFQDTPNCRFYSAEPLFALPTQEALETIQDVMAAVPDETAYVGQRARMTSVVIRAMGGDIGTALAQALELDASAEPGSWLAQQTGAFITALDEPDVKPLRVCAALVAASEYGACDVDAVLARDFEDRPLQRNLPIDEQLASRGITVLEQQTVSQPGRADRQVVRFDLAGPRWWAFAPLDPEVYTAEASDALSTGGATSPPLPVLVAPQGMYDALLVDDDPTLALNMLDNLKRVNPQADISAEIRFLEALSYDMLADRPRAREAYYALWQDAPLSIWGQLAADHLEQR